MLLLLQQNIWTIIIIAVLILVVALVIRSMYRDKKAGKCSCGNSCGGCPMNGACHEQAK